MKMFHSLEELNASNRKETLHVAHRMGFDTQQEEDGKILCGRHGSDELIEVYPNGSWALLGKEISGDSVVSLKLLHSLGEDEYRAETTG